MNKLLLISLLILFGTFGFAQQNSIKFGHIGQKEGLSQSDVNAIQQTKNGLLWVGTRNGLNLYNGFEFKIYSHSLLDATSISNNYIHVILEENDSLLWVGTENGLNLFNLGTQQFTNFFSDKKIAVWSLVKDIDGNLWIGTDKDLFKINKNTIKPQKINLSLSTQNNKLNIRKILFTKKNQLLIGTEGNGLLLYNPETEQTRQYYRGNSLLKSDVIWDLNEDALGKVAIATNEGINFFNVESKYMNTIKFDDD